MKYAPVILTSITDVGKPLERVEVKTNDIKSEEWLQNLLFTHPNLLPVSYFDETIEPLIPLGREVATNSGNVDILFVSPFGRLVLVETKLWKSPEKHRTVVAQIIDYAKEISEWDYNELNSAILKSLRSFNSDTKQNIDQIVAPYLKQSSLTLTEFQERVISNLSSGEFLLLIVGDRVSPNLALLSEALHGSPGLDFRLGLVELLLYPCESGNDWPLLVVSDIVGRTIEKTRGVIKVQYHHEKPSVSVEISDDNSKPASREKATQEVFLQKLPTDLQPIFERWFEIWISKGMHISWGVSGFSLRVKVNGNLQTVLDAYPDWAVSLIKESDVERCEGTLEQYKKYLEAINPVSSAVNLLSGGKKYLHYENITTEELMIILKASTDFAEEIRD